MCREGRAWVGAKDVHQMWNTCQRGDWMLNLAARVDAGREEVATVLDWLQAHLCCIRVDIPSELHALPERERIKLLRGAASRLRKVLSSTRIAEKMNL